MGTLEDDNAALVITWANGTIAMTLPNFLLIGAMKSGTTSLYNYLKQHPEIYMSPVKEPRFFALEMEPKPPGPVRLPGPGFSEVRDIEIYKSLFDGVTTEKAYGEASPIYIYHPTAPERIHHHIPDVKIIAILRNPTERAFSHYLHICRIGKEPITSFAEAIATEPQRLKDNWSELWHYRRRGQYGEQLQRYFNLFDRNQIRVYLNEDLKTNSQAVFQDIFQFLGVDDQFEISTAQRHNTARKLPKNKAIHSFLTQQNPLKSLVKPLLPARYRMQLRKQINQKNLAVPTLPQDMREQLVDWYREDILCLQGLIQRDLSAWLKV